MLPLSAHYGLHFILTSVIGILFYHVLQHDSMSTYPWSSMKHKDNPLNKEDQFSQHSSTAQSFLDSFAKHGSSVFCWGSNHTNRMCHFKNLCYVPSFEEFVFFHSELSVIEGVPVNRFEPTLLELTSVMDHNQHFFNYMDFPVSAVNKLVHENVAIIDDTSLMFSRFNPGNVMHVFHDDLIPLFHTLQTVMLSDHNVLKSPTIQLIMMDKADDGGFIDLYHLLPTSGIINRDNITGQGVPVCLKDVFVGLSKHTTWYQYGFHEPQGPLPNSQVTALDIHKFVSHLKHKLQISSDNNEQDNVAVVLSRKENRLLLNENELVMGIVQQLKMKVYVLSLETNDLTDIISRISQARLLIGMHGSLLILSLFLPQGAALIELFPFGINPDHYMPYKTLSSLPGVNIYYQAWRNCDRSKSVSHPDRVAEVGGIAHLPEFEQRMIMNSDEVAPHLCCKDPAWLYRIYQDTHVDCDAIISIAKQLYTEAYNVKSDQKQGLKELTYHKIFPGEVQNIQCIASETELNELQLLVSFERPLNLEYIDIVSVAYEVWVQDVTTDSVKAWILKSTAYTFKDWISVGNEYIVWVRCIIDGERHGPFNSYSVECS